MSWHELIAIIGTNVVLFSSLSGLIIWGLNKLDNDIKSLSDRLDKLGVRLDGHAQRIDQLYRMFIDLLKEKK